MKADTSWEGREGERWRAKGGGEGKRERGRGQEGEGTQGKRGGKREKVVTSYSHRQAY